MRRPLPLLRLRELPEAGLQRFELTTTYRLQKRDGTAAPGFDWGDNNYKVRGVNIGGWLVLEPWV